MLQPYKSTRSIVYTKNLASKSNLKIDVKKKNLPHGLFIKPWA